MPFRDSSARIVLRLRFTYVNCALSVAIGLGVPTAGADADDLCDANQAVEEAAQAARAARGAAVDAAEATYLHQRGAEARRALSHIATFRELLRLWYAYDAALAPVTAAQAVREEAQKRYYAADARKALAALGGAIGNAYDAALDDAWAARDAADHAWHDAQLAAEDAHDALVRDAFDAANAAYRAYQAAYSAALSAGGTCDEDAACREAVDALDAANAALDALFVDADSVAARTAALCERDDACRAARGAFDAAEAALEKAFDDGAALGDAQHSD